MSNSILWRARVSIAKTNDTLNVLPAGLSGRALADWMQANITFYEIIQTQDTEIVQSAAVTISGGRSCGASEQRITQGSVAVNLGTIENMNLDLIGNLYDTNYEVVPGTATTATAENKGTGWTVGMPIKLNFKNADNTVIIPTNVKSGATTLVSGTDYIIILGNGITTLMGHTYIIPLTAQSGVITTTYTYTPSERKVLSLKYNTRVAPRFHIKITGCTQNGKYDTYLLTGMHFNNALVQKFQTNQSTEAPADNVMPLGFNGDGTSEYIIDSMLF